MAKDPAFLYYDGDASKDMAHMNRLERGGYIDIVHAQKKFGRLSIEIIKKILGKDFEAIWAAIELIMTQADNLFFIEWVEESIEKRVEHSKIQKARVDKYWKDKRKNQNDTTDIPRNNNGTTTVVPLENEIEIENKEENKQGDEEKSRVKGAKSTLTNPFSKNFLTDWERWKKFKREQHRFTYKQVDSEQEGINHLFSLARGDEAVAKEIIKQSISQGWQGLFELKTTKNGTTANNFAKPARKTATEASRDILTGGGEMPDFLKRE